MLARSVGTHSRETGREHELKLATGIARHFAPVGAVTVKQDTSEHEARALLALGRTSAEVSNSSAGVTDSSEISNSSVLHQNQEALKDTPAAVDAPTTTVDSSPFATDMEFPPSFTFAQTQSRVADFPSLSESLFETSLESIEPQEPPKPQREPMHQQRKQERGGSAQYQATSQSDTSTKPQSLSSRRESARSAKPSLRHHPKLTLQDAPFILKALVTNSLAFEFWNEQNYHLAEYAYSLCIRGLESIQSRLAIGQLDSDADLQSQTLGLDAYSDLNDFIEDVISVLQLRAIWVDGTAHIQSVRAELPDPNEVAQRVVDSDAYARGLKLIEKLLELVQLSPQQLRDYLDKTVFTPTEDGTTKGSARSTLGTLLGMITVIKRPKTNKTEETPLVPNTTKTTLSATLQELEAISAPTPSKHNSAATTPKEPTLKAQTLSKWFKPASASGEMQSNSTSTECSPRKKSMQASSDAKGDSLTAPASRLQLTPTSVSPLKAAQGSRESTPIDKSITSADSGTISLSRKRKLPLIQEPPSIIPLVLPQPEPATLSLSSMPVASLTGNAVASSTASSLTNEKAAAEDSDFGSPSIISIQPNAIPRTSPSGDTRSDETAGVLTQVLPRDPRQAIASTSSDSLFSILQQEFGLNQRHNGDEDASTKGRKRVQLDSNVLGTTVELDLESAPDDDSDLSVLHDATSVQHHDDDDLLVCEIIRPPTTITATPAATKVRRSRKSKTAESGTTPSRIPPTSLPPSPPVPTPVVRSSGHLPIASMVEELSGLVLNVSATMKLAAAKSSSFKNASEGCFLKFERTDPHNPILIPVTNQYRSSALTIRGMRNINQDACTVRTFVVPDRDSSEKATCVGSDTGTGPIVISVVCDGHGPLGRSAAIHVASTLPSEIVTKLIINEAMGMSRSDAARAALLEATKAAQTQLLAHAEDQYEAFAALLPQNVNSLDYGTTLVVTLVDMRVGSLRPKFTSSKGAKPGAEPDDLQRPIYLLNVGDSRAAIFTRPRSTSYTSQTSANWIRDLDLWIPGFAQWLKTPPTQATVGPYKLMHVTTRHDPCTMPDELARLRRLGQVVAVRSGGLQPIILPPLQDKASDALTMSMESPHYDSDEKKAVTSSPRARESRNEPDSVLTVDLFANSPRPVPVDPPRVLTLASDVRSIMSDVADLAGTGTAASTGRHQKEAGASRRRRSARNQVDEDPSLDSIAQAKSLRLFPAGMELAEARKALLTLNMSRALGHRVLRCYGILAEPAEVETIMVSVHDVVSIVSASDGLWDKVDVNEVGSLLTRVYDRCKRDSLEQRLSASLDEIETQPSSHHPHPHEVMVSLNECQNEGVSATLPNLSTTLPSHETDVKDADSSIILDQLLQLRSQNSGCPRSLLSALLLAALSEGRWRGLETFAGTSSASEAGGLRGDNTSVCIIDVPTIAELAEE